MGLEDVEFVMAVEEEFDIKITDAEAEKMPTVGSCVDFVYSKLKGSVKSGRNFDTVRKVIGETLFIDASGVVYETPLSELIPKNGRKGKWDILIGNLTGGERHIPLVLKYKKESALAWCLFFLLLIVEVASFFLSFKISNAIFIIALFSLIIAVSLTKLCKDEFPPKYRKAGDLTSLAKQWSREEVFLVIKRLIMETNGVEESKITEEAKFYEDIGFG